MKPDQVEALIECTRGPIVESIHFGALAIVTSHGELLASYGDPQLTTFLRSSAKPFQALPFIERGGAEHFDLSDREVALLCASHSGTDEHVAVVRGIQQKIGVGEEHLLCGTHNPTHEPTAQALFLGGEKPTSNRHNCSGKHTGMLAHAVLRGLPVEDYINPQHPIQQSILQAFAEMCDLQPDQVIQGVDGCSAPNFAVPLYHAAYAMARLADPVGLPAQRAAALQRIFRAMAANGDMVAGPMRFDTLIMGLMGGKLVSKAGAEGYQVISILPDVLGAGSPGVGIAFKIADGDSSGRARPLVGVEILRQLGVLSAEQMAGLAGFDRRALYNWRKLTVGEIRPCFAVEKLVS
jgi:L-asparaginase II